VPTETGVDPAKVVKRYEQLLQRRTTVDVRWQELAEFILPHKAVITVERFEGEDMTEKVWDSTGIHANELLASSIQSSLMSDRWFELALRGQEEADKGIMDWLEQVTEAMFQAQKQSNWNAEAGELCLDIGCFGTGAIFIDERDSTDGRFGGMRYQTIAPGTYVMAENSEGRVDTLYRCYKMSAIQMEAEFGADVLPEPVRRVLDTRPDQEFEVIHGVYPRRGYVPGIKHAKNMPWVSCYVDRRTKTLLRESGYLEFPYCVPRWSKTSGEIYGRGPGHTALPDIRVLARTKELTLDSGTRAVNPSGLVNSDAVFGELELRPGAQNPVEGDPRMAWVPMESGAKFDVGNLIIADLRTSIQHVFFWEQLQLQGDRIMTATEVERRLELMRRVLGPVLGRFESELLNPALSRQFALMLRAGAFPPIPPALQGRDLDIEYKGPLARSQRAARLAASDEIFAKIQMLASFAPEAAQQALDNFDIDAWIRDQAEIAGLPSTNMTDPQYRQKVRDARAQQQQNASKLMGIKELATAGGKIAPLLQGLQQSGALGGGPPGQNGQAAA
jgi:head-to-tail connecting protein